MRYWEKTASFFLIVFLGVLVAAVIFQIVRVGFLNDEIYYKKSKLYYQSPSLTGEGLLAAEKAISLTPTRAKYHANAGMFFEKVNALDRAEKFYKSAVELYPAKSLYHFLLGEVCLKQREAEKAMNEFRQAIYWSVDDAYVIETRKLIGDDLIFDILPHQSKVFISLANLFYKERDIGKMKRAFEKAVYFSSNEDRLVRFSTLMDYGNYLRLARYYLDAAEQYAKAVRYQPKNIELLELTGDSYRRAGVAVKACTYYKKAYTLSPLDQGVRGKVDGC